MYKNFLTISEVSEVTSLGVSTIRKYVREDKFPKPVPLTDRRKGFIKSEIESWINDRIIATGRRIKV